jgi:hypothetical protein
LPPAPAKLLEVVVERDFAGDRYLICRDAALEEIGFLKN